MLDSTALSSCPLFSLNRSSVSSSMVLSVWKGTIFDKPDWLLFESKTNWFTDFSTPMATICFALQLLKSRTPRATAFTVPTGWRPQRGTYNLPTHAQGGWLGGNTLAHTHTFFLALHLTRRKKRKGRSRKYVWSRSECARESSQSSCDCKIIFVCAIFCRFLMI